MIRNPRLLECEGRFTPIPLALILLAIVIAGASSCGTVPATKYYQLKPPAEVASVAAGNPLPITLLVGPLRGSHLYREDRLVYSTSTEEMGTYQLHRWDQPPTELMQQLLWRSLQASGRYNSVNLLSSSSRGDFFLEGNLYDFREISGTAISGQVSLELELHDMKTGATLWTHDCNRDEPANGKTVLAVVAAIDQSAQSCVSDIESGLNQYFAAHPN